MKRRALPIAAALLPLAACSAPKPLTQPELQTKLDGIEKQCHLDVSMKLRALSGTRVTIMMTDTASIGGASQSNAFSCVMTEVQKLPGVKLGMAGDEVAPEAGNAR